MPFQRHSLRWLLMARSDRNRLLRNPYLLSKRVLGRAKRRVLMTNNGKPPAGGGRFLKLAGLTASVAGGYARDRVKRMFLSEERAKQDFQADMAKVGARIAETLGELKGAAMKMGQMASMAADL